MPDQEFDTSDSGGPRARRDANDVQPSDERIRQEVSDRLTTHPEIDASTLEVHVANGIVTLSGTIENRHQKHVAEYVAEDVVGVGDVSNQLKLRHGFWAALTGERAAEREAPPREPDREVASPSKEANRVNAARDAARRDAEAR